MHLHYVVLNAQLPPANPEEISTIVFPENSDTQVTIPSSAIIYQRNTEGIVAIKYVCGTCKDANDGLY